MIQLICIQNLYTTTTRNYRCFFPTPPSPPWNTLSHLHSLLISMGTNYGNFPFVRTGQPDQSCHYESFTFNQICPAKLVICWIICMGLMVFFSKNSLRWPISFLKWPVWPASSDWRPKGPCAVLSSNEQCKLWAHKTGLSRQLVSWVWHWRLHCPLHNPLSYFWVVSSANTTPQVREFYLSYLSQPEIQLFDIIVELLLLIGFL